MTDTTTYPLGWLETNKHTNKKLRRPSTRDSHLWLSGMQNRNASMEND